MKSLLWITWNIWQDGLHAVSCPIPPKRWYIMAVVCFNLTVTNKIHHNSFFCFFRFHERYEMGYYYNGKFILILYRWPRLRCRKGRKVCRVQLTLRRRSWAEKRPRFSVRKDEKKCDAKSRKQNATEQILCSISVARKSRLDQYVSNKRCHFRPVDFPSQIIDQFRPPPPQWFSPSRWQSVHTVV